MPRLTISPHGYARITRIALMAIVVIVITGGAVRVTGSGLGCPDWPTCAEGRVFAPLEIHPMIEFVNRIFTGIVVVAVIAGVLGSLLRSPRRRDLTWLSISLVAGVLAQAVLGGLSVLFDLDPRFVMSHFLLSMVLVFAALNLHWRASQPDGRPRPVVHRDYLWLGRAILITAAAVMFVGTLVTGSGPHGGAPDVVRFGFHPHDITKVHGGFVWLLISLSALTVWRLHVARATSTLVHKGEVLLGVLLAQGAIGYLQYALGVPALLVLLHIAGATAVLITATNFYLAMHQRWEPIDLDAYDGPAAPELRIEQGNLAER